MKDTLPHRHEFKRIAIKQIADNDNYNGVPPVILMQKCKCGYKYAYDLMERNEFYEQYENPKVQDMSKSVSLPNLLPKCQEEANKNW
jgi:hypothetical protein